MVAKTGRRRRSEKTMADAIEKYLSKGKGVATREVTLGSCRLDVVAYSKEQKVFKVVECKSTRAVTGIGKVFGQLASYRATVASDPYGFVDAFNKKRQTRARMRFHRWMQATAYGKKIKVEFYVCLRDAACERLPLVRELKSQLPYAGIIRYTKNGHCRDNVWGPNHKKRDYKIAKAKAVSFEIWPH